MARFVELRNELFGGAHSWIDAEKVDAFTIEPFDEPWEDAHIVQFRSSGHVLGTALLYGEDRAKAYALEVIRGEDKIV